MSPTMPGRRHVTAIGGDPEWPEDDREAIEAKLPSFDPPEVESER